MDYFDDLGDEELLLLSRFGHEGCRELLTKRYYATRDFHARRAAPGAYSSYSSFDLGTEFFSTFLNALSSFRFGQGLFKNYLEKALTHDMYRNISKAVADRSNVFHLDEPLKNDDQSELTFNDVIPASNYDDPRVYLNYAEEAMALGDAPEELDKKVLLIASLRFEGKTIKEIMRLTNMTLKMVKSRYKVFSDFIKERLGTAI